MRTSRDERDPSGRVTAPHAPANDQTAGTAPGLGAQYGTQARAGESARDIESRPAHPMIGAPMQSIRGAPPKAHGLPSRKMLMSGAAILGGMVAFALVSGLSPKERRHQDDKARSFRAAIPPEGVRSGPANYADLGLVEAQTGLDSSDAHPVLEAPLDPQFADSTASDLGIGGRGAPPASASNSAFSSGGGRYQRSKSADYLGDNGGGDQEAEAASEAAARTSPIAFGAPRAGSGNYASEGGRGSKGAVSSARLIAPSSNYLLQAGSVIPAALRTDLNSEAPGRVVAQVIAPVYDSVSGAQLLVPQGARLIGTYESGVRYGDKRMRIVWDRLILPNGFSLDLEEMAAVDQAGAAGLSARVDDHIDRVAAASLISGALSTAANAAQGRDSSIFVQSVGDAAAQDAARAGGRIVDRELDVRPTLHIPAGAKVKVLIERDLVLRAYSP